MKGFMRKNRRGEKGFTLVELLVVFTLLAVLAAIMIPSVAGMVGYGHTQAAAAELSIVQTAMDSMMAQQNIATVTAVTTNTSDMVAFPVEHPLFPDYLRFRYTKGSYECTATGNVTQVTTGY